MNIELNISYEHRSVISETFDVDSRGCYREYFGHNYQSCRITSVSTDIKLVTFHRNPVSYLASIQTEPIIGYAHQVKRV